jgi:transposase-like protein
MYCNTSFPKLSIGPRLPRGWALLLILSVVLQSWQMLCTPEQRWLESVAPPRGRWQQCKVRRWQGWRLPGRCWLALVVRLLARGALLTFLLRTSGWIHVAPLRWGMLVAPLGQALTWGVALTSQRRADRWARYWQRLYQMTLLFLLLSTLGQVLQRLHAAATPCCCFPLTLGTWCTTLDDETEICITTTATNRYQITLRGAFTGVWEPRDSFELWMLILFLRHLQRVGTAQPCLTQCQVAEAFDTNQSAVSRWEAQVQQHGWHFLSDRFRHQLHSRLPNAQLSRAILNIWVPAFWLSAWEVRERLIHSGVIADRDALNLESLHALAQHTGFAQVRTLLLERFHLQDGQLSAREHWWLRELLALNERLLTQLEHGERLTPQELLDIEALRLPVPHTPAGPVPVPALTATLEHSLFQPPDQTPDSPVRCTYCNSDQVAPKSQKPRFKSVLDRLGHTQRLPVLRYYCHNPACSFGSFTHLPAGLLPHSPHPIAQRMLGLELYAQLLSTYRRSARLLGVKAPTLYRWLVALSPAAQALAAYLGVIRTSGVIGIDDKWVKVCSPAAVPPHGRRPRAVWCHAFFAVDVYSYDLLALELYPQSNAAAVRLFLLQLRAKGIYPRVVVTDLDPAYGRMLPCVFPRTLHHECLFHALQNAQRQLTQVYGRHYRKRVPEAAALHQTIVKLFHARTRKTVRKRFAQLLAARQSYVDHTPAVACVFDSLEHHFPTLVNAFDNPLIPRTNNAVELVIRRFDQHYQSMCGFDNFASAQVYLRLFELVYRLTPFAEDNPSPIRGRCPLQLAGYDLDALPVADLLTQLKLPTLALSPQELVPMP